MTDIDMIVDCCNHILRRLIGLYENSEIDEIVFRDNSYIKVQFLISHINKVEDKNIKCSALHILDYLETLKTKNFINVSSCNTQV